jgi:hypothetical protein
MSSHEITFNTNLSDTPRTRAGFTHRIGPTLILITDTGLGSHAVTENIKAVLRRIEHWHQGSITKFKTMCQDGKGLWHGVRWDNKSASLLALQETDERQARKMLEHKSEIPGGTSRFPKCGRTISANREAPGIVDVVVALP